MAELVKIWLASAEYQARFERPYVGFIGVERLRAFEAVLTALLPFDLRLENTEFATTGTPAEYRTIFRIPERGISFQFGAEEYRFSKEFSSWATAEKDSEIFEAAERALLEGSSARVASCRVIVAMHLQPLTMPREVILAPFIPEPFKTLMTQRQTQSYAVTHGSLIFRAVWEMQHTAACRCQRASPAAPECTVARQREA